MIKKRNGFLTFIFSLVPGAGEMYMGFLKQGTSIMLLAFGLIALAGILELGPLVAIIPVIWCYSFFHVNALATASDEEFYSMEDHYIFDIADEDILTIFHTAKSKKIFAIILIVTGVGSLWSLLESMLSVFIGDYWNSNISTIFQSIPRLVVGILIIMAGVYLIKGKKQELDKQKIEDPVYIEDSYVEECMEKESQE